MMRAGLWYYFHRSRFLRFLCDLGDEELETSATPNSAEFGAVITLASVHSLFSQHRPTDKREAGIHFYKLPDSYMRGKMLDRVIVHTSIQRPIFVLCIKYLQTQFQVLPLLFQFSEPQSSDGSVDSTTPSRCPGHRSPNPHAGSPTMTISLIILIVVEVLLFWSCKIKARWTHIFIFIRVFPKLGIRVYCWNYNFVWMPNLCHLMSRGSGMRFMMLLS